MRPMRSPGVRERAFVREADDPSRDEAGDLDDAEATRGRIDDDAVALVVLARLVEVGVEEQTGMIDDLRDAALDRRAVHVAIEDRHEDRHPLHRRHAEAELRRRRGEAGGTDDAVGRRDDEIAAERGDAGRIAEEVGAPQRRDEAEPAERRPDPPQDQRRDARSRRRRDSPPDGSARADRAAILRCSLIGARTKSARTHGAKRPECHGAGWEARPPSASRSSSLPARRNVSSAASTSRWRLHSAE